METIEIKRVKNGWVVFRGDALGVSNPFSREAYAFETFDGLVQWMKMSLQNAEVANG